MPIGSSWGIVALCRAPQCIRLPANDTQTRTKYPFCRTVEGISGCKVMKSEDLYTVTEFCELVRISVRQYYRMRAADDGPSVTKLGGRHLISRDEMRRWLAAHTERQSFHVS